MKTATGMWAEIVDFGSLYRAYIRARRGKRTRAAVQDFELDLEGNLIQLSNELIWGEYRTARTSSRSTSPSDARSSRSRSGTGSLSTAWWRPSSRSGSDRSSTTAMPAARAVASIAARTGCSG